MSSANHNDRSLDEQLDRNIAALRDEPTEAGPSERTLNATLAMLDQSRPPAIGRRNLFERLAVMSFPQRIAAVVMLTLGALTLYAMFALFNSLAPSVALADVVKRIQSARTLSYVTSATIDGKTVSTRTLMAEPDLRRTEMPDGTVIIGRNRSFIILNTRAKTATRTQVDTPGAAPLATTPSIVDAMTKIGGQRGEKLDEKEIEGVRAIGFRSQLGGRDMIVWADKKTSLPVRVEMSMAAGGKTTTMVMNQFVVDAPLSDDLFSLDPPAGYKLVERAISVPVTTNVEEAVVALLRITAEHRGGKFLDMLNDWPAVIEATKGADQETLQRALGYAGSLTALTSTLEHGYAGKGVTLGEKDKIIFWYKLPEGTRYRALFGDLRFEHATKDQLPATKPAAK
jgi:outer membrane lipoprotein-sorting protein